MRRWRPALAGAALSAALAAAAAAQPDLVTDRPDQTESTAVVPRGSLQLEAGALWTEDRERGVEAERLDLGGALLRWGVAERAEVRLGWGGWVDQTVEPGGGARRLRAQGLADPSLGGKVALADERGRRPAIAFLAATTLPVGDGDVGSDRFDPQARVAFSHDLGGRLSLGYNLGATWSTSADGGGDRDTLARGLYTLSLGISAGPDSGFFAELFGDFALSASGGAAHAFDAGWTYKPRSNLQLDVAAGVGISREAPDWQIGAGVSVRWPE